MPRKASSQWEFGELFSPKETRRVLSVSQLTSNIRTLLENQIGTIWVSGEVTNLRVQASGHAYFSLKDPESQLGCVLFRGVTFAGRNLLDNGAKVLAHGDLTVYEPRGQYQLVVRELEFQGAGSLQLAFEKLKRELEAKGYFASERKRILPRLPARIGIATSASGAALRDVIHVIQRRHPGLEVILAACRVQGDGAAREISEAIRDLNLWSQQQTAGRGLDAILVTRGGGSLEDLWAFNEPPVAEAIYRSALPVVSAVGHEIDFTICDFVADVRAATPSAAAEILTDGAYASRVTVADALEGISTSARRGMNAAIESLNTARQRLRRCAPTRMVRDRMQYLDDLGLRIARIASSTIRSSRLSWSSAWERLKRIRPGEALRRKQDVLHLVGTNMNQRATLQLKERLYTLNRCLDRLRLLSPMQTLARGYSITMDKRGQLVRSANDVKTGDQIETHLAHGWILSTVDRKKV